MKLKSRISSLSVTVLIPLLIGIFFVASNVGTLVIVRHNLRQKALQDAQDKARLLLEHNLAIHTYFTHDLKPALFETTAWEQDADTFQPEWMSSTYAVRLIHGYFNELNSEAYYYKEAAVNARSPGSEAEAYEQEILGRLNQNPELMVEAQVRELDGEPYYVVLHRGEAMESACLHCHSTPEAAPAELVQRYGPDRSFGREVGDVVSAISIRIPLRDAYAAADRLTLELSALLFVLLGALFVLQGTVFNRWLAAPLATLEEKSSQIAKDSRRLGEEILLPRGQELQRLAQSFNAMSVALRDHQDRLEEKVEARTEALRLSNRQLSTEVAERRRAEEALRASEALRIRQERLSAVGQLTTGLAHALNNMLASIILRTELIRRKPGPCSESDDALQVIQEQSAEAAELVSKLLDFSRKAILRTSRVDLTTSVQEQAARLRATVEPNVEVVLTLLDDGPLEVEADAGRLEEALDNLVQNALEAMPDGGRLGIKVGRLVVDLVCAGCQEPVRGEWIRLAVSDSGEGISAEAEAHLFEPFFTTRGAATHDGLGLSQILGIVKQHGGHLTVDSEPGEGTTVSLYWRPGQNGG